MTTHKIFDNEVYTLREFYRVAYADKFTPTVQEACCTFSETLWWRSEEGRWLRDMVRDIRTETHFDYDNDFLHVRITAYIRDSDYTLYLLQWK